MIGQLPRFQAWQDPAKPDVTFTPEKDGVWFDEPTDDEQPMWGFRLSWDDLRAILALEPDYK